jgi:class 3 adenylate cyclase
LTDIVDSVSLWERDPVGMAQAVARHDALIQGAVDAAGGQLVRTKGEGDSTFSVFAQPTDAMAAAVGLQDAVASEPWPPTAPLAVRAGVHTGDAEPRDEDWYGPAVNRAARLRALADGGRTLVSGVTAGLVADQLPKSARLLYRGRRVLRGIERPEEVWELVAADDPRLVASESMPTVGLHVALNRFVGHAEDVQGLAELLAWARLVTLTGPGGAARPGWRSRWRGTPSGGASGCGWQSWRRCETPAEWWRRLPSPQGYSPGTIRSARSWRTLSP